MFSTSIVTVAGGLGVIIPPSISYIVYSSASGASPSRAVYRRYYPGHPDRHRSDDLRLHQMQKERGGQGELAENYNRIHDMGFWNLFKESFARVADPVIILGSIYGNRLPRRRLRRFRLFTLNYQYLYL
ncbi:MAG: hypothetical protein ACLR0U_14200 [Enterocloster clostridioformis]